MWGLTIQGYLNSVSRMHKLVELILTEQGFSITLEHSEHSILFGRKEHCEGATLWGLTRVTSTQIVSFLIHSGV